VRRRRRIAICASLITLPVLVWAPSLVAMGYRDGSVADALARPDRGWHFLADSVLESRGAALGWEDAALVEAKRRWQSRPRAEAVSLRWGEDSIDVGTRRVALRSPLNWIVTGTPKPGTPSRVIAILDYHSGRVVWSLKTRRRAA
jgi:hypothetical protein